MATDILANEINYNSFAMEHGTYMHMRIIRQVGTQTENNITTNAPEAVFEMPPRVYNLSRSYLYYTVTPAAPPVNQLNYVFNDTCAEIRQVQVYTRNNLLLVDINNVNNYVNAVLRHETKFEDAVTNDTAADGEGYWEGLQIPTGVMTNAGAIDYLNPLSPVIGTAVPVPSVNTPPYYVAQATEGQTATPIITRKFPLNIFKNTLLALDKDLYLGGETFYIRFVFDVAAKVYGIGTALNNLTIPGGGAATSYNITNLTLYAAAEINSVIENRLKNKVMTEGFKMAIPYVWAQKVPLPAQTSHTIMVRYNSGHGQKLLKIIWAPWNVTESNRTTYDHNNLVGGQGAIINTFYTTVNNVRTSQFNYICSAGDDYMVKSKKLKGSCITNTIDYYTNFCWREEFDNNSSMVAKPLSPPEENYVDGLDLRNEQIYAIYATTEYLAFTHYMFAVCQKTLMVNSGGVQLVSDFST